MKYRFPQYLLLLLIALCLLSACGSAPEPTADLVATQIAVEEAAHAMKQPYSALLRNFVNQLR